MGMCALYEGCARPAWSVRLWRAAGCLTQNLADFNGQFADGCDPLEPNWAGHPLYRPRDNLAMLHGWDWQS
jgi:hypothetical protein